MTNNDQKHKCTYCGREFVKERTLINHMCEKKRRHFNKDEKYVQIGFDAWKTFYKLTGTAGTKERTYKDFINSNYYLAFVRFGKHVIDTNMVNPSQFIPFVIKKHIKLDNWCKDSIYEEYVRDVCRREDVNVAMERQIKLMAAWAKENDEEWILFFEKVPPGLAYKMIITGRLSPWVLLNSKSSEKHLFPRFSDEQLLHIADFINFDYWRIKMIQDEDDTRFVKALLEDNGL